nr:transcription termination factor Rho [Isoptericola halotolerans]
MSSMKLAELQALASQMGVKGTSRMRKGDLAETIRARRSGGAGAPAAESQRSSQRQPATERPATERPAAATVEQAPSAAPVAAATAGATAVRTDAPTESGQRRRRATRPTGSTGEAGGRSGEQTGESSVDREARLAELADAVAAPRERGQRQRGERQSGQNAHQGGQQPAQGSEQSGQAGQSAQSGSEDRGAGGQNDRQRADQQDRNGSRRRRGRDRGRDRKRGRTGGRGPGAPDLGPEEVVDVREDDVLLPVAGILDILDSYAFVRTSGYLPGPKDVYVSLNQVRKAGLRRGDAVVGAIRQPRDGEEPPAGGSQTGKNVRSKFAALVRLDTVNGMTPDEARQRPEFTKLTPLYPQDRLRLENPEATRLTPRVIDIVAPIGKGQRGLIVSPPKAGKTIIMQQIANAITANNPEVHLMVVLVDERPEEVTDMERTVKGEVIASTFDRPASDHTIVAELAIERAKRLVELGQDVVVLLDSITRLSRAYNLAAPASGRILSGGVDAAALYPPKKFFGAARNIEEGGSLTILGSALVETGSKMDEVIFEEFKGTGNMELRLSRNLADKRIFPAVDVNGSGTRREEILLSKDELGIVYKLRRVMGALDQQQAIELLLGQLKKSKTNVEFLLHVQKTTPAGLSDGDPGETI